MFFTLYTLFVCLFVCQQEYERQQTKLEKMEKLNQPPAKLEAVSFKINKHSLLYIQLHIVMANMQKYLFCIFLK